MGLVVFGVCASQQGSKALWDMATEPPDETRANATVEKDIKHESGNVSIMSRWNINIASRREFSVNGIHLALL